MQDEQIAEKSTEEIRAELLSLSTCEKIYAADWVRRPQLLAEHREKARAVRCVREFDAMWREYQKQVHVPSIRPEARVTRFEGQELELDSGDWQADDYGITALIDGADVYACPHALMPIERQIDVDTGAERIVLAYKEPMVTSWKTHTFDRSILSDSRRIVGPLSGFGIAVTSESARFMVRYIFDVLRLNDIPCTKTVSHLGWSSRTGTSFIPYLSETAKYGGDAEYSGSFDAVSAKGNFTLWKDIVLKVREESIVARAILNASFASVLIEPLGKLPFFAHIWGPSGTGKTVTLMLAMSIWGNPDAGALVKSLNGTNVGLERMAAFFNSIPLALDELQTRGDRRRKSDEIVYMLSGGQGKPRGTRAGGIEKIPTWRNCILTTGEQPLIEENAGGGALNRILNFYQGEPLFKDAPIVANTVKANYGHAGCMFVLGIAQPEIQKQIQQTYDRYYRDIVSKSSSTEKQAMAAALLVVGEYYSSQFVFGLTEQEAAAAAGSFANAMIGHLASAQDVDDIAKAYDWIVGWAAANNAKFNPTADSFVECWGEPDGSGGYYIIAQVLQKVLSDSGMSCRKILQGLASRKNIETREEAGKTVFSIKRSIAQSRPRCIHLYGDYPDYEQPDDDELPL